MRKELEERLARLEAATPPVGVSAPPMSPVISAKDAKINELEQMLRQERVCTRLCMYVCVCVCMYVCLCVCIYMCCTICVIYTVLHTCI